MQHTKRYGIVFEKWSIYGFHRDITEYDTIKEVNEEIALIEEMYKDTPRPEHKFRRSKFCNRKSTEISDYAWCAANIGEAFWGYLVLDFEEEKLMKWGHDCLKYQNKDSDPRLVKDIFLRGKDEVPKDYKWDCGEYAGWLQFRWGDGRNSVKYGEDAVIESSEYGKKTCTCIKNCKCARRKKKKKFIAKTYDETEEVELDNLNAEILAEVGAEKVEC